MFWRSAFSTASSSWPSSGFTNTVAWRRSGDMRTSVTLTRWFCSVVMDIAALQQFAQHMAHLLADAEQADRAAFGGFGAAHQACFLPLPRSRVSATLPARSMVDQRIVHQLRLRWSADRLARIAEQLARSLADRQAFTSATALARS